MRDPWGVVHAYYVVNSIDCLAEKATDCGMLVPGMLVPGRMPWVVVRDAPTCIACVTGHMRYPRARSRSSRPVVRDRKGA